MTDTTVAENRIAIIALMLRQWDITKQRIQEGHPPQPWNPDVKPHAILERNRLGVLGMRAARKMEEAREVDVISGSWSDGAVRVIAGPKFPYPEPDRTARQVARFTSPIRDILTEEFLRECEKVAAEMEVLNKRRDVLWMQIADKVYALPDRSTANTVFNEISFACAAKDGKFRDMIFDVERVQVMNQFMSPEDLCVNYGRLKHEPTDTAEGFLPAGTRES
ncbi:hypothetical protein CcrColossus_gp421 [Caulobacter phage CcrColossus]|uniref:Uncharacterized protein n=1 Tax=Caulobacter phage CcrColossus TaxID=1211640 RepID=K4JT25_9CAUD|nr:hypothetical protein CcrColossus_gp421 [Caulobacter phage CcrColossus]AFU88291.1 hypothetical protein CcrColossus_gp421 [Caulobacter phage CcrColossus]